MARVDKTWLYPLFRRGERGRCDSAPAWKRAGSFVPAAHPYAVGFRSRSPGAELPALCCSPRGREAGAVLVHASGMQSLRGRWCHLVMLKLLHPPSDGPLCCHRVLCTWCLQQTASSLGRHFRYPGSSRFLPVSAVLLVFSVSAEMVCINSSTSYLFYKAL